MSETWDSRGGLRVTEDGCHGECLPDAVGGPPLRGFLGLARVGVDIPDQVVFGGKVGEGARAPQPDGLLVKRLCGFFLRVERAKVDLLQNVRCNNENTQSRRVQPVPTGTQRSASGSRHPLRAWTITLWFDEMLLYHLLPLGSQ